MALRLRETDLQWREVDDEVIVLDLRTQQYLSVNGTGAVLWDALVAGATTEDLSARLESRFGIDRARAAADVAAFVSALDDRGLLEPQ